MLKHKQFHSKHADMARGLKPLVTKPQLLIPMALIHVIPLALTIHGVFKLAIYHEQHEIERERTKQARYATRS
ncbi:MULTISPECIES: hypothetical protein [Loigolactobacillus]|uniref:Uncharacterized protein n=1 Tax=Loigolactobacillus backii TaxID=375175 RepID=A0A192GZS0_9LACO|nr:MULTISPECIES: hypothetical protein [Loigolactobacillus]ANK58840.1 hypothetical protein AYR52_00315 [Loigolactobacillus backii]ANK61497.1 hypothetical protein AYR53_01195 [Loigolactobacillus backii]ANK63830.1 hypothetical protein AYR54_00310 [Loigolactobacillus backii]ANK66278.1 hypothetical protein AYR55_00310 [Loigolactobacillus backii]ANK69304.1 hypothetical protein AYR56_03520 [Loigolactobacillus backii]